MDEAEAKKMLAEEIARLRRLTYKELVNEYMDKQETKEVVAPSGKRYQIEIQSFWDGEEEGNLRVSVAIDDGGWRSFVPVTSGFIIAPDGSFIGELMLKCPQCGHSFLSPIRGDVENLVETAIINSRVTCPSPMCQKIFLTSKPDYFYYDGEGVEQTISFKGGFDG